MRGRVLFAFGVAFFTGSGGQIRLNGTADRYAVPYPSGLAVGRTM